MDAKNKTGKQPYYKIYPADFSLKTNGLSDDLIGKYARLLNRMSQTGGYLRLQDDGEYMTEEDIGLLLGIHEGHHEGHHEGTLKDILKSLLMTGCLCKDEHGRFYDRQLVKDSEEAKQEHPRKQTRKHPRKHHRKHLRKQTPTNNESNA